MSGTSFFSFEHILHFYHTLLSCRCYSTVIIAEQINAAWAWENIVTDNKSVSSNSGKCIVLWAFKIC